jgi:hypothetical protein
MLVVRIPLIGALGFFACSPSSSDGGGPGSGGGTGASGGASNTGGTAGVIAPIDAAGGSSAGGSGGLEPDGACTEAVVAGERTPGNILFVVDRSGSMNCNPPPLQDSTACETAPVPTDPGQPSKWDIVNQALKDAIASLPGATSAGIVYFPNDSNCGVSTQPNVPVGPLTAAQLSALHADLDGVAPAGNTPIVGGVTLGFNYLRSAALNGNKFVVLLTDGAETCAADQVMKFGTETVPSALSLGMRTFVIGAPGSESARAFLSAIAFSGGTAQSPTCDHSAASPTVGDCHFDMTTAGANFAQQLNQALDAIAGSTVSCEIDVPPPPDGGTLDLGKVNVTLDPGADPDQPLYQDNTLPCDGGADGWQYNQDKTKIILCGNACTNYKTIRDAAVKIELGCEVRIKIT